MSQPDLQFDFLTTYRKIVRRYMDYRPREEEASLERARESLIAISYCEPEKVSDSIEPEKSNTKDKAVSAEASVDELRAKLISIASDGPSVGSD
ncbi:hypothetical protein L6452_25927 [Arctium lappa]|uniref:Uncharacterized protein n=1 Tax=Arctium lappa TaxID=4217 RepID=A0ACB9AB39_ARCLA|nr:hypothetical protein L6452_25927 [Arctium lappa]